MAQSLSAGAYNLQVLGKHPVQESVSAAKSDEREKGIFFFKTKKTKRRVKDIFGLLLSVPSVRHSAVLLNVACSLTLSLTPSCVS